MPKKVTAKRPGPGRPPVGTVRRNFWLSKDDLHAAAVWGKNQDPPIGEIEALRRLIKVALSAEERKAERKRKNE